MFFIADAFKGQVHKFAGRVKIVSHQSCRTSAVFKYFLSPVDPQNRVGWDFVIVSNILYINAEPWLTNG